MRGSVLGQALVSFLLGAVILASTINLVLELANQSMYARLRVDRRARPRTWANAVAPVIAGTGAAAWLHGAVWWKALRSAGGSAGPDRRRQLPNDYSDGIRGTDDERAGPLRLVGSKIAAPRCGAPAAIVQPHGGGRRRSGAGRAERTVADQAVGAACIAGAWLYTGGSRPYGYAGFGEVAVFVFFGLVAVLGTQFTQAQRVDWVGLTLAVATGALSSAVLVASEPGDIPTDTDSGKVTLAVRLAMPAPGFSTSRC